MTCSSGSRDTGLGAARGFRARGRCLLLQGDDADAVFGFFDSPPPPKPVDEMGGVTLQQDPEEGEAAPPGSTREGEQYRCSCPVPATRKSPAAENLRLFTKPTWRGQGRMKGQGRVRGSHRLLLLPKKGSPC